MRCHLKLVLHFLLEFVYFCNKNMTFLNNIWWKFIPYMYTLAACLWSWPGTWTGGRLSTKAWTQGLLALSSQRTWGRSVAHQEAAMSESMMFLLVSYHLPQFTIYGNSCCFYYFCKYLKACNYVWDVRADFSCHPWQSQIAPQGVVSDCW